jgi:hypothetical protein
MPRKVKTINTQNRKVDFKSSSERILLEEYQFLYTQYLNRRTETLTRMNFFITAASVSLGGVLVFGSGNANVSFLIFKSVLLAALIILFTIGIEIHTYMIHRDIASDRDLRGLARIRRYFLELDPQLENYFVNHVTDAPTGYLVKNTSGMRRVMQIIEGFLIGLAIMLLSTFLTDSPFVYLVVGIGVTIFTYLILETISRRGFRIALQNANREAKHSKIDGE